MTDYFDSPVDPDDEQLLDEALVRLRRIEPPLEARVANRLAISVALEASTVVRPPERHWWQRSISVPVPLAASVLLASALAIAFGLRSWNSPPPAETPNELQAAPHSSDPHSNEVDPSAVAGATIPYRTAPAVKYYAAEKYLCGVGRIHTEARYLAKEQKP